MHTACPRVLLVPPPTPDPSHRYLFYLHGMIVEMAGIRPKSEEHGYYEYELILQALADQGFVVISEVREKNTEVKSYAAKIAAQIRRLLAAGVPPDHITMSAPPRGGSSPPISPACCRKRRSTTSFSQACSKNVWWTKS